MSKFLTWCRCIINLQDRKFTKNKWVWLIEWNCFLSGMIFFINDIFYHAFLGIVIFLAVVLIGCCFEPLLLGIFTSNIANNYVFIITSTAGKFIQKNRYFYTASSILYVCYHTAFCIFGFYVCSYLNRFENLD